MAAQTMITVEGLKELIASLENMDSTASQEARRYLRAWSIHGVKQAQIHILNIGAVDTNELIQGFHYDLSSSKLESVIKPSEKADKYAAAIEYGTSPHFPPIKAIQGWADRHGIPAWAVALKIAREGTKARPYIQPTYEDLENHVDSDLDNLLDAIVRAL